MRDFAAPFGTGPSDDYRRGRRRANPLESARRMRSIRSPSDCLCCSVEQSGSSSPLDKSTLYAPPGLDAPRTVAQQIAASIVASIVAKIPGARITDLDLIVRRMRLVKDSHELSYLRQAAEISGRSFLDAMREIRPGRNDREIAGVRDYAWKKEVQHEPRLRLWFRPVRARCTFSRCWPRTTTPPIT